MAKEPDRFRDGPTIHRPARYYDPATGEFLTRDPIAALTREPYGYTGGNPINRTDPTGMDWCVDVSALWSDGSDNCNTIAKQHPGGTQQVVDFAGGVLDVNPITAPLPLDLAGHGVNTQSGAFTTGKVSMFAFLTIAGYGTLKRAAAFNTGSTLFYTAAVCSGVRSGSCADGGLALFYSGLASGLGFNLPRLEYLGHLWNTGSNFHAAFSPTTWGSTGC